MLAVLPAALTAAAAAVDAVARTADPLRVPPVGGALERTVDAYAERWAAADDRLEADLSAAAELLRLTAARYADLEQLLVPVALR